jgi:putative transposase
MKSDKDLTNDDKEAWQKEVPYDTRQEAIDDAIVAWKTSLKKIKAKQISKFDISYKSKKATSQIFRVNKKALKVNKEKGLMNVFVTRLKKKGKLRMRKRDIEKFYGDGSLNGNFLIVKTRPDYWYVCLPRVKSQPVFEEQSYQSVFLDPGVRTFQTFYSPEGICGKINPSNKLYKMAKRHDHLHIVSTKVATKTKYHLNRRMAKIRHSIKNVVNDLHWKTCYFLCKNFKRIVMPPFKVSELVEGSKLGSTITRKMLGLSHGLFQERLKWYCQSRGTILSIETEEYTTQTCGACGFLQKMDAKKTYNCPCCGLCIDRDYNGARNICIKSFQG